MARDGLRLARLTDHEELRQDGDRLQVDGERPQDLSRHIQGVTRFLKFWRRLKTCVCRNTQNVTSRNN